MFDGLGQGWATFFSLHAKIGWNGQIFSRANRQFVFFPENTGQEQKKGLHVRRRPVFLENISEEQKMKGRYVRRCPYVGQ